MRTIVQISKYVEKNKLITVKKSLPFMFYVSFDKCLGFKYVNCSEKNILRNTIAWLLLDYY